jgi:hypothetical protein
MLISRMISKMNNIRSHTVRKMKFFFEDMGVFDRKCWKAWKRKPAPPTIPTSSTAISNTIEILDILPPYHCT